MAVREILQLGNPRLRLPSEEVEDPRAPEMRELITDLTDTLDHWRATTTYGRGIAAPQIGVHQRVIFLNLDQESPWPMINPQIVDRSRRTMIVWDACLSFLSIFMQVVRDRWIVVRYQDLEGAWHEVRAEGALSELLQHEIDHLDGILTLDRLTDLRTLCTREEFEKRFRAASPLRLT
jgi:peptide deformylase